MIRPGIGRALLFVAVFGAAIVVPVSDSSGADGAPPPYVAAEAWYLVGDDDTLLGERGAHERRAIASITKLMTAVVTLEHARLSDVVTIGAGSSRAGESTAHLRAGEQLSVATLLQAMLVASANDAARALALHVGQGSTDRFVSLMNAKARELGLDETNFENPHGLDEQGHVSSAEDVTQLLRYALGIGFIRDALDRSSVVLPGDRELATTDDLLDSWPPLVGGKTGHTADAGWSEAAAASRRGATVYGSVLGSGTRTERNDALRTLLAYGLDRYRRVAVIDSSRPYAELETAYDRPTVELVAPRTVVRSVHEQRSLVERVVAPSAVELPVRRGQRLGRVDVYDGNRLVASSVLVAAEAVSESGLVGKAAWYAERTAENLWGFVT